MSGRPGEFPFDSMAPVIQSAKVELGPIRPCLGRGFEEFRRLFQIAIYEATEIVYVAEVAHRLGTPQRYRFLEERHSFLLVGADTLTVEIKRAQVPHRLGITAIGRLFVTAGGVAVGLRHGFAQFVVGADDALVLSVTLRAGFPGPPKRSPGIFFPRYPSSSNRPIL